MRGAHLMRLVKLACVLSIVVWTDPRGAQGRTTDSPAPESFMVAGRTVVVHVPRDLPAEGTRALVVVLHGGLGNAQRIASQRSEAGLNMDVEADRSGFVVAYLNGTAATRYLGEDKLGWNAGECCGLPAENKVDDVGYISGAVHLLVGRYGIDPHRVYGVGHSNGAMMTLRLMCETDFFAAAVAVSGALEIQATTCPRARGKSVLAIRGAEDENVPMAGGRGKGLSAVNYRSQDYTRQVFIQSGAQYTLEVLSGAAHSFDGIDNALLHQDGTRFSEKAARFFNIRH